MCTCGNQRCKVGRKLSVQKERVQDVKAENERYRKALEEIAVAKGVPNTEGAGALMNIAREALKVRTLSGTLLPSR